MLRNAIFCSLLCIIIFSPLSILSIEASGMEISSWLSPENAKWLSGGYENPHLEEHFSAQDFMDGNFQNAFEMEINNHIPAKASLLLINAAIQRKVIEASNYCFDWSCYPTFYGSRNLYIPAYDALCLMPAKGRESFTDMTTSFGAHLTAFAEKWPSTTFNIVLADMNEYSSINPANTLCTNVFSTQDSYDILKKECLQISNVNIAFNSISTLSDYFENYYTTDYHWNGFGAARTYAALQKEESRLQLDMVNMTSLSDLKMNGCESREGLMLLNESVCEPRIDFSSLINIEGIDPPNVILSNGTQKLIDSGKTAEFDFYHCWYGPSASFKANSSGDGKALIICDSFGSAFQWFVINNHDNTTIRYDMHVSMSGDQKLGEIMTTENFDEVYFVSHAGGFANMLHRFPHYLD